MRYSLSASGGKPSAIARSRAETIGFVCDLARGSPLHAQMNLRQLMGMLDTALSLEQVKVYFNDYGECMGYVVWALLAPDVAQRFLRGNDLSLHLTEWNEGTNAWIIDFLVPLGSLDYVLADLRDSVFKDFDYLTYIRVKKGRRIFRCASRAQGGYFFRKGKAVAPCGLPVPLEVSA
ncbi:MAG: toxin-activating lysine-acyltransferase [Usitatibacteraceae bacterium]